MECRDTYGTTLYELEVTHPEHGVVRVNTTHPRIDDWEYAYVRNEITEGHTLIMRFQKFPHSTGDVLHVTAKGSGWYYEVF